ncbi:MAG: hypothetical protein QM754_13665 [Tepidisphaeraceae bacterium]
MKYLLTLLTGLSILIAVYVGMAAYSSRQHGPGGDNTAGLVVVIAGPIGLFVQIILLCGVLALFIDFRDSRPTSSVCSLIVAVMMAATAWFMFLAF